MTDEMTEKRTPDLYLKNDVMTVGVSLRGAELLTWTRADGTELLWEGLPSVWGHVSPLLFPFPGVMREGSYLSGGRRHMLPSGGVAMGLPFSVEDQTASRLILKLAFPQPGYPFEAELLAAVILRGKQLTLEYDVVNPGYAPLYYGLGRQLAFTCPEGVEFQRLLFDQPETPEAYRMEGGYLDPDPIDTGRGIQQLSLSGNTLPGGCLILGGIRTGAVTLLSVKTGRRVRMDTEGFRYLRVWRRPRASFISLEPWTTLPDRADSDILLSRKDGIEQLPAGKTRQYRQILTLQE